MSGELRFSVFHDVFFPNDQSANAEQQTDLTLQKVIRFQADPTSDLHKTPLVVFDFETTGLDSDSDRIIEIGAIKYVAGEEVAQYSTLVDPELAITEEIEKITGITGSMLEGQPKMDSVLGELLEFIEGSILVAHNAEFDMAFLRTACLNQGIHMQWPAFCTLKMARAVHPDLPSKNLDTLAEHYGLTFEARHRSIGDCKVTAAVMFEMLAENSDEFETFGNLKDFYVTKG